MLLQACKASTASKTARWVQHARTLATTIPTFSGKTLALPDAEGPVGPITVDGLNIDTYKKAYLCPHTRVLRTSTHIGMDAAGKVIKGKVGGSGISKEEAYVLARGSGLRLLSTIHNVLDGDMSRVEQVLKLTGLVNAEPDFAAHGFVINGCSEVFIEAFGPELGVGIRETQGPASLLGAVSCSVELRVRM